MSLPGLFVYPGRISLFFSPHLCVGFLSLALHPPASSSSVGSVVNTHTSNSHTLRTHTSHLSLSHSRLSHSHLSLSHLSLLTPGRIVTSRRPPTVIDAPEWPGGGCVCAGRFVTPGRFPIVIGACGGCARAGRFVTPGRPPVVIALADSVRAGCSRFVTPGRPPIVQGGCTRRGPFVTSNCPPIVVGVQGGCACRCRFVTSVIGTRSVWSCRIVSSQSSLSYLSCHVLRRVASCHLRSCDVAMLCRVMSAFVWSCRIMSCHVMS